MSQDLEVYRRGCAIILWGFLRLVSWIPRQISESIWNWGYPWTPYPTAAHFPWARLQLSSTIPGSGSWHLNLPRLSTSESSILKIWHLVWESHFNIPSTVLTSRHAQPHTAHSWNRKQKTEQETRETGQVTEMQLTREVFPFQDSGLMFQEPPVGDAISSKSQRYTKTFPQSHWIKTHCQQDTGGESFWSLIFFKEKKNEQTEFDKIIPSYCLLPPKKMVILWLYPFKDWCGQSFPSQAASGFSGKKAFMNTWYCGHDLQRHTVKQQRNSRGKKKKNKLRKPRYRRKD